MEEDRTAAVCRIQNLQGLFIHRYVANDLAGIADALFANRPDVRLEIPAIEGPAIGLASIREALAALQRRRVADDSVDMILLHTPSCVASHDGTAVTASWDAHVHTFRVTRGGPVADLGVAWFESRAVREPDGWKFVSLVWREMQSFVPRTDDAMEIRPLAVPTPAFADIDHPLADPQDWYDVRNFQNLFAVDRRRVTLDRFAESPDCAFGFPDAEAAIHRGLSDIWDRLLELDRNEFEQGGRYQDALILTTPVISIAQDRTTAEGWWLVRTFRVTRSDGDENGPLVVRSRFGTMRSSFVRTKDGWRVREMLLFPRVDTTLGTYDAETRYHLMRLPTDNWIHSGLAADCGSAKDAVAIENLLAAWIGLARRGDLSRYAVEHMIDGQRNVRMHIRSQGAGTPLLETGEAILAKLGPMDRSHVFKNCSYHAATTPVMNVDGEAGRAEAVWLDCSLTNLGARSDDDLERSGYMLFLGFYCHHFERIGKAWKHTSFEWEPLLALPDLCFHRIGSRGWAGSEDSSLYPLPAHLREAHVR
jgi:hypothetical protein